MRLRQSQTGRTWNAMKLMPRLRFSIRAMLVATTLLCLWCGYSMNWIRQRHAAIASGCVTVLEGGAEDVPSAPRLLWLFGEAGYFGILVDAPTDEETAFAVALFPEVAEVISVVHEAPWEEFLEYLAGLRASIVAVGPSAPAE
jgi:hypothetical protein